MIHWKELGTQGRIDAIRSVWAPNCSAAQIAAHFDGATRNSVIGAYHRHGKHLLDMPLTARSAINEAGRKSKQLRAARATVSVRPEPSQPKPLPVPRLIDSEHRLCGKPLVMLKAKECRWSVNEEEQGGLHLFCGRPAEGSYCAHHRMRSYQPVRIG